MTLEEEKQLGISGVSINNDKISKTEELKDKLWGKGKVRQTVERVLLAVTSVMEVLKGTGIWNYAENITIGNLTTKFNAWVATLKAGNASLTGSEWQTLINSVANTFGIIFSTVLTFVIEHPAVTVLGVSALFTTLLVPFKALIRKLKGQKQKQATPELNNAQYEEALPKKR